jgi:hypothetical protein
LRKYLTVQINNRRPSNKPLWSVGTQTTGGAKKNSDGF